jgi:hypothetical protein
VYTFINTDPEAPSQNMGISNSQFCQESKLLFVTDDKGYLRAYDLSWIVDILHETMKAKADDNKRSKS